MAESAWTSCFHPRWLLLTLLAAVVVLVLTHIPNEDIPRVLQTRYLDKVEHVAAYGLITGFFLLSLRRPARPGGALRFQAAALLIGLAALAVLGVLDEATQPLVNRVASVSDYICDLIGVAIPSVAFLVGRLSGFLAALR